MKSRILILAAFVALIATPAAAQMLNRETIKGQVTRGASKVVTWQGYLNPRTCEAGALPTYKASKAPRLGVLAVESKTITASNGANGSFQCAGKSAPVVVVTYRAGHTSGEDRFDFYVTKQGWSTLYEVIIKVE